jgi:hypothetical protein
MTTKDKILQWLNSYGTARYLSGKYASGDYEELLSDADSLAADRLSDISKLLDVICEGRPNYVSPNARKGRRPNAKRSEEASTAPAEGSASPAT